MPAAQALRGFSRSTAEPNSSPKPKNPLLLQGILWSTPNGIRTRAATLRGWCPRPLDDGGLVTPHER